MHLIHEILYYLLTIFAFILSTYGDYKTYHGIYTKTLIKDIKKNSQDITENTEYITALFGERIAHIVNAIMCSFAYVITFILLIALCYQAKVFENPNLIHIVLTYIGLEVIYILLYVFKIPNVYFSNRPITKILLVFMITISIFEYILLILMIIYPIL